MKVDQTPSKPKNKRSELFIILLFSAVCFFLAYEYGGPYIKKYLSEKGYEKISESKSGTTFQSGGVGYSKTETKTMHVFQYDLFKVPQCFIDYRIKLKNKVNVENECNKGETVCIGISSNLSNDIDTARVLTNGECKGKAEYIASVIVEFEKFHTFDDTVRPKLLKEAEEKGGNYLIITNRGTEERIVTKGFGMGMGTTSATIK